MNGIYWDCDGTLMDTETSYGLAWKEHLSEFGLEISEEETRQWVGIDDRLVHSFYAKNVDLENFEKTMASLGKIIEGTLKEHGGDPKSIQLCSKIGLNYVSCSPYRVPIARLAAAQAQIKK